MDATKHERGTVTPRYASSGEGSSPSEESSSSEDTTPPIVVLVVPGRVNKYARYEETPKPQAGKTTGIHQATTETQRNDKRADQKMGDRERVDG